MCRLIWAGLALAFAAVPAQAGWLGGGGAGLPKAVNLNQPRVDPVGHGAPRVTRLVSPKYGKPDWGFNLSRLPKQQIRPLRQSFR